MPHPSLLAFVLGGRPFKCEMCPKAFARSHQLAVHQPVHTGEKAHLCSECGNAFSSVSSLIDHRKRRHLELRDHKCTLCPKGKFFCCSYLACKAVLRLRFHHSRNIKYSEYNVVILLDLKIN